MTDLDLQDAQSASLRLHASITRARDDEENARHALAAIEAERDSGRADPTDLVQRLSDARDLVTRRAREVADLESMRPATETRVTQAREAAKRAEREAMMPDVAAAQAEDLAALEAWCKARLRSMDLRRRAGLPTTGGVSRYQTLAEGPDGGWIVRGGYQEILIRYGLDKSVTFSTPGAP